MASPFTTGTGNTGAPGTACPRVALSLTLTNPLNSPWQSGHLLGRWHDRKVKILETYLNVIPEAMLTWRCHRSTQSHCSRSRRTYRGRSSSSVSAWSKSGCGSEVRADAFIEGKAEELARLQKVLFFRRLRFKAASRHTFSRGSCHSRSRQRPGRAPATQPVCPKRLDAQLRFAAEPGRRCGSKTDAIKRIGSPGVRGTPIHSFNPTEFLTLLRRANQ